MVSIKVAVRCIASAAAFGLGACANIPGGEAPAAQFSSSPSCLQIAGNVAQPEQTKRILVQTHGQAWTVVVPAVARRQDCVTASSGLY